MNRRHTCYNTETLVEEYGSKKVVQVCLSPETETVKFVEVGESFPTQRRPESHKRKFFAKFSRPLGRKTTRVYRRMEHRVIQNERRPSSPSSSLSSESNVYSFVQVVKQLPVLCLGPRNVMIRVVCKINRQTYSPNQI